MSRKKPDPEPDLFSSVPPRETFAAFPTLDAFPEQAIAFLTGKGAAVPEPTAPRAAPHLAAVASVAAPAVVRAEAPEAKPVSKPHTKPEKKPISQPVVRPATAPACQSVSQSVSPTENQPDSRDENRTASPSASLSPAQQAPQPATLQASPSESPSHSQSGSRTVDDGAGPSVSPSASPSQSPTFSPFPCLSGPGDRLNANQRGVLDFLLRARPYIVKFRDIAAALGMREATVRTILRRLAALGILTFKKARDGNIQGVRLEFHQAVLAQYGCDLSTSQTVSLSPSLFAGLTMPESASRTVSLTQDQTVGQTTSSPAPHQAGQQAGQPATPSASLRLDRKDLSILPENAFGWDDAFLAMMWPAVHKAGFRVEQIRQAVAARARLDKALDMESVRLSLERADWELETTGRLTELGSGEAVKNPQAYVFTALARWGMLRAHPDYVSREEVEAAAAAEELKRRRAAAARLEDARFEAWRASLGEEDLARALAGCPGGPKEQWLRNYWRKHGSAVRDG